MDNIKTWQQNLKDAIVAYLGSDNKSIVSFGPAHVELVLNDRIEDTQAFYDSLPPHICGQYPKYEQGHATKIMEFTPAVDDEPPTVSVAAPVPAPVLAPMPAPAPAPTPAPQIVAHKTSPIISVAALLNVLMVSIACLMYLRPDILAGWQS